MGRLQTLAPTSTMTADPDQEPTSGRERRRWPRAKADWPISLDLPEGRYEARVRDISQAGVCFFLDRPLKMMTTLQVELELEMETSDGEPLTIGIRGHGIVVRSEKISERIDHYEIAVFMPELTDAEKEAIREYVTAHPELAAS
jgi:hypothetical protein